MMHNYRLTALSLVVIAALFVSGLDPFDRPTWLLEVFPVLIALPLLIATRRSFPLTTILYFLIGLHALILIYGGAYTYARVPLGFWLQELLGLNRNPYDKIGHFAQGLVPMLVAREILLRGKYLTSKAMTGFLSLCVAMTVSACYEIIEWLTALALGQGAYEFLGTQGDIWDTQEDVAFALLGATLAWLCLVRFHDRQIAALEIAMAKSHSDNPQT